MTRDRDRQPRFMNKWITSHRYVYLQLRSDQVDKMVKLLEQYTMIIKNTHTRRHCSHSHTHIICMYLKMRCSYVDWITGDEAWVPTETIRLENGLWCRDEPPLYEDKCLHVTFFWPPMTQTKKIICPPYFWKLCIYMHVDILTYRLLSAMYAHAIHINND